MNIALIGYGKMGKAIEQLALEKGHTIVLKISFENAEDLTIANLQKADVAIEFTGPEAAAENIKLCLLAEVPVVCGSTGWLMHWDEIVHFCKSRNGGLIYASNYSIGVNLFFELNVFLARLMNKYDYNVQLTEVHHTEKKDAPSGTAITLANQVLSQISSKKTWVNRHEQTTDELQIISERTDPAPGTHKVKYTSSIDDIEIIHTAHNRHGFATGAILAAEFLYNKKGIFTMKDVLGL